MGPRVSLSRGLAVPDEAVADDGVEDGVVADGCITDAAAVCSVEDDDVLVFADDNADFSGEKKLVIVLQPLEASTRPLDVPDEDVVHGIFVDEVGT